jgi:PAS domain S-box-containing protein
MISDLFKKSRPAEDLEFSERRYRRVFEAAQDGILLLDFQTGMILDVNKFLIDLLGYSKEEFLSKHIWDVGAFKDISSLKENFGTLQSKGYVRFENLPLQTKDGKHINVEFVANAYKGALETVIQCNIRDITDRVKAEEKAKVSELRYRRLFETAQDGILLLDFQTGMITDVNKFLIDILGYSKDELITKYVWEVGLFKNEAEQKENFAILQDKGYVRFENLPLETMDKKPINVEFVANAYDVDGETVIQCNIRNITDRVRADEKLRWLASFPTLNPKPIIELDQKLGIVYANPTAETLFPDLYSLQTSHPFLNESQKYFEELQTPERNHAKRELSFNNRWYQQEVSMVSSGRLRIYGSDITDLKNNEYALAIGKSFDEAILSSIGEVVIVCDKLGKINLFNKKAEELIGLTSNEAVGSQYSEVVNLTFEKDGSAYKNIVASVISSNEAEKIEKQVQLVNKAGVKIPIAGSASPIKSSDGSATGAVLAFFDATKEHDVDKAKTEFVSLASHQMRTPLTVINWYSEMLESKDKNVSSDKQDEFATEIHSASKRMSILVNSLLNVSRLELGTFMIEPVPLSVSKLAKENIEALRPEILNKKILVEEDFDQNIGDFMADPNLLGIVFQNLLTNSVKYTQPGGTIRVTVKKEEEQMKIIVSDNGVGIPKADQSKIFTKLFRSDNVKTIDPAGTGLGLYIVRDIVVNAGGKVWFESEEGAGTAMYVTFPMTGMRRKEGEKGLIQSF